MNIQYNDFLEGAVITLGVLALVLTALLIYLIFLLARIEQTLWRMQRLLYPEVKRDGFGKRIYSRF